MLKSLQYCLQRRLTITKARQSYLLTKILNHTVLLRSLSSATHNQFNIGGGDIGIDDWTKQSKLTVAIVGRPNTGKSTLFNRLTRTKTAIVSHVPGTTRDRREGEGYIAGLPMNLIDTGGLDDRGTVSVSIQEQVKQAFGCTDVVLFLLDARVGVTALDLHFAQWIRRSLHITSTATADKLPKSVILVANKTEGAHLSTPVLDTVAEALRLGFGDPVLISASHGDGMADLVQCLLPEAVARGKLTETPSKSEKRRLHRPKTSASSEPSALSNTMSITSTSAFASAEALMTSPSTSSSSMVDSGFMVDAVGTAASSSDTTTTTAGRAAGISVEERVIQMAIMGRPNVGKSTLLNAFLGEERSIAGPLPGLTRDAVHVSWQHRDRHFRLVDTAGLTRIRTNKQLLSARGSGVAQERRHRVQSDNQATTHTSSSAVNVKLPGRQEADPEADPSQFSYQISEMSLVSALNALRFAQVVLLVVEGTQGKFTKLELQLARRCLEEGRGLVIAANKMDLIERKLEAPFSMPLPDTATLAEDLGENEEGEEVLVAEDEEGEEEGNGASSSSSSSSRGRGGGGGGGRRQQKQKQPQMGVSAKQYEAGVKAHVSELLREFGDVPVIVTSGTRQQGIRRVLNTVMNVHDAWSSRIDTGSLNHWLRDLLVVHPLPRVNGKLLNIKYITQVKSRPPTFAIFANQEELPGFFERFLRSNIQDAFKLEGIPIRFVVRKSKSKNIPAVSDNDNKTAKVDFNSSPPSGGGSGSRYRSSGYRSRSKVTAATPKNIRLLRKGAAMSGAANRSSRNKTGKKGLVGPQRKRQAQQRQVRGYLKQKRRNTANVGVSTQYESERKQKHKGSQQKKQKQQKKQPMKQQKKKLRRRA